jgi:hypothetical protein
MATDEKQYLPSFHELKYHFMFQLTPEQKRAMKSAFMDANIEIAGELSSMIDNPDKRDGAKGIRVCVVAEVINKILDIIIDDIKRPTNQDA